MEWSFNQNEIDEIIDFRHYMHENPEVSHKEFETTKRIELFLSKIEGIEILPFDINTGVIARIRSKESGINIGLRCDIDAIEQVELYESANKSKIPGMMHACGHDTHTASLLGTAILLSKNRQYLKGDVIFVFQPAEETTTGALEVINAGLFEKLNIAMFFGLHNWPLEQTGKVICKKGALMSAKSNYDITIIGRGGHGSNPHLNVDPIVCASSVIMSLQTILSRNINPLDNVVLSINSIRGGSEQNLVVDNVHITATIRSLSQSAMNRAKERFESILENTCKAYECTFDLKITDDIPLTFNSDQMYEIAVEASKEIVGEENIVSTEPTLASEDFAFYMKNVPSFMYWFGSANDREPIEALHSSYYHAEDDMIPTAAKVLANTVFVAQNK